MRDLLLGREATELNRRDIAEQPVERRPIRREVEALHVEHPAVAGGHDHGPACGARVLAQPDLHLQVVALVHDHVGARDEVRDRRLVDPGRERDDADVRIQLGDLARGQHDLAHADVGDAARHPVQVREVQHVEVGEPQLAADALVHHRRDDGAPDRQAGHGHAEPAQPPLLLPGDRIPVAVEAQLAVQGLRQDVHQPAAPRIEDPGPEGGRLAAIQHALDGCARLGAGERVARRSAPDELLQLRLQLVDDHDAGIRSQGGERRRGVR